MIFLRTYNCDNKEECYSNRSAKDPSCMPINEPPCRSQPITRLARANGCRKNIQSISPHAFRISPLAGGPRLRPDLHHQIIHIHLQESKTIRRNPGYSNPLSQHWDHIITTSITRRTVRPWLVMMMTSRATGFNGMGASSLSLSPTLLTSSHGRPLSNSSETPQCATARLD